jgi:hypothetical protein
MLLETIITVDLREKEENFGSNFDLEKDKGKQIFGTKSSDTIATTNI